jgi:hypothetical protein
MSIKFSTQQYFGWKIYEKYFFNTLRIILILSVLSQQISYFESDFRNSATINNNTQMVYTKYSLIRADDVQAIDSLRANSGVLLCRRLLSSKRRRVEYGPSPNSKKRPRTTSSSYPTPSASK